ncbi:hypothetical protein KY342_03925 [Candidatus Woesearchaeota archaeon]|nr:hypothetical protein [Candidatus Woesearchaeota archaeon]
MGKDNKQWDDDLPEPEKRPEKKVDPPAKPTHVKIFGFEIPPKYLKPLGILTMVGGISLLYHGFKRDKEWEEYFENERIVREHNERQKAKKLDPSEMVRKRGTNIVAPPGFDLDGRVSLANSLLIDFPNKERINAAYPNTIRSIDKYLTPGARYCGVHLRKIHLDPTKKLEDYSEEELRKLKLVSDNSYNVLSYLIDNFNLERAHEEGITEEYLLRLQILFSLIKDPNIVDSMPDKDIDMSSYIEEAKKLEQRIPYDPVLRLALEGRLEILPASFPYDAEKRIEKYSKVFTNKSSTIDERLQAFREFYDKPENDFFVIAAKYHDFLKLVSFGSDHAFGGRDSCGKEYPGMGKRPTLVDNIAEWNSKHPKEKYSWIEITVNGLDE